MGSACSSPVWAFPVTLPDADMEWGTMVLVVLWGGNEHPTKGRGGTLVCVVFEGYQGVLPQTSPQLRFQFCLLHQCGHPQGRGKETVGGGMCQGTAREEQWLGDMVMRAGVLSLFYAYPVGDFSTGA